MKYEAGKVYEIHGEQRLVLAIEPELVTTTEIETQGFVEPAKESVGADEAPAPKKQVRKRVVKE